MRKKTVIFWVAIAGICGWAANPNRIAIKGKEYYLNGINVAWNQWNKDLTHYDSVAFEGMFRDLAGIQANAIRWWWFPDGASLTYSGNLPQALSQEVWKNLDQAFRQAERHGIKIMPCLLSFDIKNTGKTFLVTDSLATKAFVDNVVKPLVTRYNDHPAMGIWEIMNEWEWLLSSEGGTVSMAQIQRFHGMVAAAIHEADSDALVTTGSAMFKYMTDNGNQLSDALLRSAAGGDPRARLDVYQTHYYSWMHGQGWSYEPWIKTSSEWLPEGKPVIIGEFACKGEEGRWSSMDMHVKSVEKGYAGSFCWAYFDNRQDKEGYWPDARPGMQAIAQMIPEYMTGKESGSAVLSRCGAIGVKRQSVSRLMFDGVHLTVGFTDVGGVERRVRLDGTLSGRFQDRLRNF